MSVERNPNLNGVDASGLTELDIEAPQCLMSVRERRMQFQSWILGSEGFLGQVNVESDDALSFRGLRRIANERYDGMSALKTSLGRLMLRGVDGQHEAGPDIMGYRIATLFEGRKGLLHRNEDQAVELEFMSWIDELPPLRMSEPRRGLRYLTSRPLEFTADDLMDTGVTHGLRMRQRLGTKRRVNPAKFIFPLVRETPSDDGYCTLSYFSEVEGKFLPGDVNKEEVLHLLEDMMQPKVTHEVNSRRLKTLIDMISERQRISNVLTEIAWEELDRQFFAYKYGTDIRDRPRYEGMLISDILDSEALAAGRHGTFKSRVAGRNPIEYKWTIDPAPHTEDEHLKTPILHWQLAIGHKINAPQSTGGAIRSRVSYDTYNHDITAVRIDEYGDEIVLDAAQKEQHERWVFELLYNVHRRYEEAVDENIDKYLPEESLSVVADMRGLFPAKGALDLGVIEPDQTIQYQDCNGVKWRGALGGRYDFINTCLTFTPADSQQFKDKPLPVGYFPAGDNTFNIAIQKRPTAPSVNGYVHHLDARSVTEISQYLADEVVQDPRSDVTIVIDGDQYTTTMIDDESGESVRAITITQEAADAYFDDTQALIMKDLQIRESREPIDVDGLSTKIQEESPVVMNGARVSDVKQVQTMHLFQHHIHIQTLLDKADNTRRYNVDWQDRGSSFSSWFPYRTVSGRHMVAALHHILDDNDWSDQPVTVSDGLSNITVVQTGSGYHFYPVPRQPSH